MILVDTSVWVVALRDPASRERRELDGLLQQDVVTTTDVVVGEVLQGARSVEDFLKVADRMDALHYLHADKSIWSRAARLSFDLRRQGLTTALSDVLIATVAIYNDCDVYAIDSDFERIPGVRLHQVSA